MSIPKILHFVLIDLAKLSDQTINSILQMCSGNFDFQVWIWFLHDSNRKSQILKKNNAIQLKKINQDILNKYISYEINQIIPNYLAAHHLLKYEILFKHGGIYVAENYILGKNFIADEKIFEDENHRLYLDLNILSKNTESNEIIICSKNNPIIGRIAELAKHNYNLQSNATDEHEKNPLKEANNIHYQENLAKLNLPSELVYYYEDKAQNDMRHYLTQQRSGKECIKSILQEILYENESTSYYKDNGFYTTENLLNYNIISPTKKLNSAIDDLTIENIFDKLKFTISFEYLTFNIFRLDDYMYYLIHYLNYEENKAFQLIDKILNEIRNNGIIIENVLCIKLTFSYLSTINYCIPKFLEKTFLLPGIYNNYIARSKIYIDYYKTPLTYAIQDKKYEAYLARLRSGEKNTIDDVINDINLLALLLTEISLASENIDHKSASRPTSVTHIIELYLADLMLLLSKINQILSIIDEEYKEFNLNDKIKPFLNIQIKINQLMEKYNILQIFLA